MAGNINENKEILEWKVQLEKGLFFLSIYEKIKLIIFRENKKDNI